MSFSFSSIHDDAESCVQSSIMHSLDGKRYRHKDVGSLVDSLNDTILDELKKLSDNLKYIVSTTILQSEVDSEESSNTSAKGLSLGGCALFDADSDGALSVQWSNDSMTVICNVYGILI